MAQYLRKDSIIKVSMSNYDILADVFNQFIYSGKPVILPEQLRELDIELIAVPYGDRHTDTSVQRFQDISKLCAVKERAGVVYFLFGIEN